MNKINYLLILMLFAASFMLLSQTLSFNPNTGDKKFDAQLNHLNAELNRDLKGFSKKTAVRYKVSEKKINHLLEEMEPVEVLLSLHLQNMTSRPLNEIVAVYKNNNRQGWKAVTFDLGISKKSPEYRELRNIVNFSEKEPKDNSLSQR